MKTQNSKYLIPLLSLLVILMSLVVSLWATRQNLNFQKEAAVFNIQTSKKITPVLEHGLGLIQSPPGNYPKVQLPKLTTELPVSVDYSSDLPPVGNQGDQPSCAAWAVGYYYRSYQEGIQDRRLPRQTKDIYSPAFIYNQRPTGDCSRGMGMQFVNALRIAIIQGVASLQTMPYNSSDPCVQPSAAARTEASLHKSESFLNLFSGSGTANLPILKQYLATEGPFLLGLPVYTEFYFATARNPVIDVPASGSTFYGGHGVLVIGYDENARTFKFVNSWGSGWAKNGFAYLTYAFVQQKAWEAWVLDDFDTTPPDISDQAYELGGAQNNIAQGFINRPIFGWSGSDGDAVYNVYWGPDPEGTSLTTQRQTVYEASSAPDKSTYYLRVSAEDPTVPEYLPGRSIPWRTMFIFRYDSSLVSDDDLILQPLKRGTSPQGVIRVR